MRMGEEITGYTLTTGPACEFGSSDGETKYWRALAKSKDGDNNALVLINQHNIHDLHSEAVSKDFSRDEIDERFASCPCHDPDNLENSFDQCLALESLRNRD